MDCGGRGGGGIVMGNLSSICLVLRIFGVPRRSPRVWFENSPCRAISAIGEVPLLSVKLGLWVMELFTLAPLACGISHSTSALQSPYWLEKVDDKSLSKHDDQKDSRKCDSEQVLLRPMGLKGQEMLQTSLSGLRATHSKLRAYLFSFHRYIKRNTSVLPSLQSWPGHERAMHLMISKSTLIVLLLKVSGISTSRNFIKPQIKNQNLFSLNCSQGQEIVHTKQNLNKTICLA